MSFSDEELSEVIEVFSSTSRYLVSLLNNSITTSMV